MKLSEIDLQKLLDDMHTFVGIIDLEGTLIFVNNSPVIVAGLVPSDVIGKPVWDCYWFSYQEEVRDLIKKDCANAILGQSTLNEVLVRMQDELVWVDFSIHPVFDEQGKVIHIVPEARVITERKQAQIALQKLNQELEHRVQRRTQELEEANTRLKAISEIDPLTTIFNRRMYERRLSENIAIATRAKHFLSLLMIDIDYFKDYNDNYGHNMGDIALKRVAETIRDALPRRADLAARFGGEEFVVLLPSTDLKGALITAEKIRLKIKSLAIRHKYSAVASVITASIGVASLHGDALNAADLLKQADASLYSAKHAGRDCCESLCNT